MFLRHLVHRVRGATHVAGNLLDVVTAERSTHCLLPTVVDTGFSDHKLLTDLSVGRVKSSRRTFQYRKVKTTDAAAFGDLFRTQPVVRSPSTDVNEYVDQLERSVSAVLDVLAPLKTVTKHGGRPSTRWLTEVAVNAKRTRRRLEWRWNCTGYEADRVYSLQKGLSSRQPGDHQIETVLHSATSHGGSRRAEGTVEDRKRVAAR